MKIRTQNLVPKGNPFANQDCYIGARIPNFNIINLAHDVYYERLVDYVAGQDQAGNDIIRTKIVQAEPFPNQVITSQEVNAVLASFEADLNAGYNYHENILAALHEAFRLKVQMDGRYGDVVWVKTDGNYQELT